MKNLLLLLLFFVAVGSMFVTVFVPNLEKKNAVDQLHYSLFDIRKMIPDSAKVYILPAGSARDTEIYYKSQLILAPHIVVSARYSDIAENAYILSLKDAGAPVVTDSLYDTATRLYAATDRYFTVSLYKKGK